MDAKLNYKLDWVNALKAFAIIGILMVHSVESFNYYPWFSKHLFDWPELSIRLSNLNPDTGYLLKDIIIFLGWLGDMGPGVFIFLSGLTLTLSSLHKKKNTVDFYRQRILKIYPLYITIHIFILLIAILLFKWEIRLFSFSTLFSLLGIRFTEQLFFYINPSWWFVWTIIQLYFLFPLLFWFLKKASIYQFLLVTLLITIISRYLGLTVFVDTKLNYYWVTGIFAGTRLFEFTLGMAIGLLYFKNNFKLKEILSQPIKLLLVSILILVAGITASLSYFGNTISMLLITIGLSTLFYSIYSIFFIRNRRLNKSIQWIGKNSFGVFLLHQPFMIYAAGKSSGYQLVFLLLVIICLSFFIGSIIERVVYKYSGSFINKFLMLKSYVQKYIDVTRIYIIIIAVGTISFFIPMLDFTNFYYRLLEFLFFTIVFLIFLFRDKESFQDINKTRRFVDISFFITGAFILFTRNWYPLYFVFLLSGFLLILITSRLKHLTALVSSLLIMIILTIGLELHFKKSSPVEIKQWGELPALQIDKKTGYGLIPNKQTRLKYNNYDYILKTNSLGFASPEINLENNDNEYRILIIGDAFSMPEGVEYEYSYPFLLENKLNAYFPERNIKVINAAVTGYGPNEFYAQTKKYIDTIKPNLLINQFFINEFEEINYELHTRNNGIGFFLYKYKRDYYFGNSQLPANYLLFYRSLFDIPDHHFNRWKSLISFYEINSEFYNDTIIGKMKNYLQDMKNLCNEYATELLIAFVPGELAVSDPEFIPYLPSNTNLNDTTKYDINKPNDITRNLCDQLDMDFIDLTNYLKNHENQPVYFPESWHWNQDGHSVVAEILTELIKTKKLKGDGQ